MLFNAEATCVTIISGKGLKIDPKSMIGGRKNLSVSYSPFNDIVYLKKEYEVFSYTAKAVICTPFHKKILCADMWITQAIEPLNLTVINTTFFITIIDIINIRKAQKLVRRFLEKNRRKTRGN